MPDALGNFHGRLILKFISAVVGHWKAILTSSVVAALLWLVQGVGWVTLPRWVYGTVAVLGLPVAAYQTWLDQHRRIESLTRQLTENKDERKKELIRVVTELRSLDSKVMYWRDIANGKWGTAKPAEKLQVDDLSSILFEAEGINPALRTSMETVAKSVAQAESLLRQFMAHPAANRQEHLMKQILTHLDEAAPLLSQIIAEFVAVEAGLR